MHVRFRDPAGSIRTGSWTADGVAFGDRVYDRRDVDILAPTTPSKVVCVGLNYADHAAESDTEPPDRPLLFFKTPNTVASHRSTVSLPPGKERVEYEAELGVVISDQCRAVDAADAMDVVAGFTAVNDISNRDDQRAEVNWVRGKAFDNAAPIGPVVTPPEDVPGDASIELRVNGATEQASSRDELIFSVPTLIEEITTLLTLEPGDVIATGTPAGVGPLSDGDDVEIDIEGIPTLRHGVTSP